MEQRVNGHFVKKMGRGYHYRLNSKPRQNLKKMSESWQHIAGKALILPKK